MAMGLAVGAAVLAVTIATAAVTHKTAGSQVCFLLPDSKSSIRWEQFDRPSMAAALKAAGVSSTIVNAQGDPQKQRSQADQCLANGAKVLIIAPLDSGSAAAIEKAAKAKGVASIDYDRQVEGGVAQGIGAVLLERAAYDESGQFLSGSFMDYLVPTATDIPNIEIEHLQEFPLDADVNFRGVGEGGMIVCPPTICNAIEDALSPYGTKIYEQHLPPARILELIGAIERE